MNIAAQRAISSAIALRESIANWQGCRGIKCAVKGRADALNSSFALARLRCCMWKIVEYKGRHIQVYDYTNCTDNCRVCGTYIPPKYNGPYYGLIVQKDDDNNKSAEWRNFCCLTHAEEFIDSLQKV